MRDALVERMGSKHGETTGTEPTARRETIRFGFERGFTYGHLFTGLEEAAGNGSNATPIPPRWSGVFIKAYARGQRSSGVRMHVEGTPGCVLSPDVDLGWPAWWLERHPEYRSGS